MDRARASGPRRVELVGLPGAGKTTWVREALASPRFAGAHTREDMEALVATAHSSAAVPVRWARVLDFAARRPRLVSALVAYESSFLPRRRRDGLRQVYRLVRRLHNDSLLLGLAPSWPELLLDQGLVQQLWAVAFLRASPPDAAVRRVLRRLRASLPNELVWIRPPPALALERMRRRLARQERPDGDFEERAAHLGVEDFERGDEHFAQLVELLRELGVPAAEVRPELEPPARDEGIPERRRSPRSVDREVPCASVTPFVLHSRSPRMTVRHDPAETASSAATQPATPPVHGGPRLLPGDFENEVAERFDRWLARMLELSDEVLDEEERRALLYYDFVGKERRRLSAEGWRRYLRGVMRGEEWMLQWIHQHRPRIFCEIGAGVGTWVFLAGLAEVPEVYGVDVFSRFLRPALKLESHFNALGYGRAKFIHRDIYDVKWDRPVDIFYLKSTIHHVLPLGPLFDYMHERLAPGGLVIVHDPNGANPISQLDVLKRRGLKLRDTYVDELSGKTVTMANEDLLTVPGLLFRFKQHGFRIKYQQYNMGFRTHADDWWYYNVVQPLSSSLALGAFMAPTYTIAAMKPY